MRQGASPRSPLGAAPSGLSSLANRDAGDQVVEEEDDRGGEEDSRGRTRRTVSIAIAANGRRGASRGEAGSATDGGTLLAIETGLSGSYEEPTYMPSSQRSPQLPIVNRYRSKSGPREDVGLAPAADDGTVMNQRRRRRHRHLTDKETHVYEPHDSLSYWTIVNHQPGLFLRQPRRLSNVGADLASTPTATAISGDNTEASVAVATPPDTATSSECDSESDFDDLSIGGSIGSDDDADADVVVDAEAGNGRGGAFFADETTYLLARDGNGRAPSETTKQRLSALPRRPRARAGSTRRKRRRRSTRVRDTNENGCSTFSATVSICKLVVGVGSYALPKAFSLVGFIGGAFLLPVMAILCSFSISLLVQTKARFAGKSNMSYVDLVRASPSNGGSSSRAAIWLRGGLAGIVNTATIVASIGACVSYVDFTTPLLSSAFGGSRMKVILLSAPIFICLALIREFAWLSVGCLIGELSFIIAIITIGIDGFATQSVHAELLKTFQASEIPSFLGAASFLFAICLFILPIEQAMTKPSEFPWAVNTAFALCACVNVGIGGLFYLMWGADVQDVIVNNLQAGTYATAVKLLLVIDVCFTFPLVLAIGREFLEKVMLRVQDGSYAHIGKSCVIRLLLVGVIVAIAIALPSFLNVLSLVGGLALISTTLMIPPLLYVIHHSDELGAAPKFMYFLLALMGFLAASSAVYAGLVQSV